VIHGEFVNLRQANRALKALPAAAKTRAQGVMNATSARVASRAQGLVRRRTGLLQSRIVAIPRPRSVSAVVGVQGPDAYYWKFVEYGTVKMPARPFMRPAAMAEESQHKADLETALSAAADEIARGV
jgi:HK97 gp10 family phage protein